MCALIPLIYSEVTRGDGFINLKTNKPNLLKMHVYTIYICKTTKYS